MRNWLQDRTQSLEADSNIDEVAGEEEIIVVANDRRDEVGYQIEEGLQGKISRELHEIREEMKNETIFTLHMGE